MRHTCQMGVRAGGVLGLECHLGFTDKHGSMGTVTDGAVGGSYNTAAVYRPFCGPKVVAVMVINNILLLVFACPRVDDHLC